MKVSEIINKLQNYLDHVGDDEIYMEVLVNGESQGCVEFMPFELMEGLSEKGINICIFEAVDLLITGKDDKRNVELMEDNND